VIYCLVGTYPERLQELVTEASQILAELKKFDSKELSKELRMQHSKIAHARLAKFRVDGYTFDARQGFKEVYATHGGG
jgi:mRNA-degrading endonuclease RelE of RelBE toxin-antitoxin system